MASPSSLSPEIQKAESEDSPANAQKTMSQKWYVNSCSWTTAERNGTLSILLDIILHLPDGQDSGQRHLHVCSQKAGQGRYGSSAAGQRGSLRFTASLLPPG